jgi:DNA invertase Pin-like site-specific DNA recombinase
VSKKRGNGERSKRAILYARVSTEEQMKGYSIPDQLRELRAKATWWARRLWMTGTAARIRTDPASGA